MTWRSDKPASVSIGRPVLRSAAPKTFLPSTFNVVASTTQYATAPSGPTVTLNTFASVWIGPAESGLPSALMPA